ncbi:MAG: ankyrin repeat domain-containing protein [Pseudomonadota bacterium]|nr:ankyrin repeat domain-containing protein [Pseudomonadota bacterium]
MNEQLMDYLKGGFEDRYPLQLEAHYARVFEKIVALWGTAAIEDYFSELLIANRPDRQGFPPEVAREIFSLSIAYDEIQRKPKGKDNVWHIERDKALSQLQELGLRFTANDLMKAVESGDPARVLLFLSAGMSVDVRDSREWTPLMVAAFNVREDGARLFIKHGANIHAQDRGG